MFLFSSEMWWTKKASKRVWYNNNNNNNNFKVCCKCKNILTIFLGGCPTLVFSSYTHQSGQLHRIFFLAAKLLKASQQASCEWHVRERKRERERECVCVWERERGCLWAQSLTRPLPEALMDICPMTDYLTWLTYRQADSRGRGLNLYTNT
jgi:hypothetical protein